MKRLHDRRCAGSLPCSAALTLFAALASGCISLQREPPQTMRYVLEPATEPTPTPEAAAARAAGPRLTIRPLHAASVYAGRNLIYRLDEHRIEPDFYHEYAVPPSIAIAECAVERLALSPAFSHVGLAGGLATPDLVLEGDLLELSCDETGASPAAVVRTRFVLHDPRTDRLLWHGPLSARIELRSSRPDEVVAGCSRALAQVLDALAEQLERTLAEPEDAPRD